jgi:uncharacterized membrane protein YoaK (UPF0700 family)
MLMSEDRWHNTWLPFGLAFIGGYGDASSFILAKTFTGHITGNFVLTAISLAGHDFPNLYRRVLAIALFMVGIILSVTWKQYAAGKPFRDLLPVVLGLEVMLVVSGYFALTSQLGLRLELFVICMALALGLQNGAWREAGGVTVHSTYLSGMTTNLLALAAARYLPPETRKSTSGPKISLLVGIVGAFVLGAVSGATLVFRFQAGGILGAAVVIFALLIGQSIILWRR